MVADRFVELCSFLESLPSGAIRNSGHRESLAKLLAQCWTEFAGSDSTGMEGWKLLDRPLEKPSWSEPILTFRIERHGALVQGSTRAEVYCWEVDIKRKTAKVVGRSKRQVKKMARRVSAKNDSERVAQAILNHDKAEESLSWKNADKVKLEIGMLYPDNGVAKPTLTARRKRFWTALLDLLKPHGWSRSGQHLIRGESRSDQ